MNQNAERIKTALKGYKEKREAADARIKQIRELYGDEAAQHEAERQNKTLKAARATVEETIRAAHGEGRRAAEAWGTLDGSKLTDDIKLLDAGLVDREAFNGLKTRYKDNATMLSALRKRRTRKPQRKSGKAGTLSQRPFPNLLKCGISPRQQTRRTAGTRRKLRPLICWTLWTGRASMETRTIGGRPSQRRLCRKCWKASAKICNHGIKP